jgi:hypothetical protein
MALNSGGNGDSSSVSPRAMTSKSHFSLRRRRSKGTIAGFAFGKAGDTGPNATPVAPEANGGPAGPSEHSGSIGGSSTSGQGNQPQHAGDSSSAPAKPCHAARLALMCSQNAIRMGARTQLGLCPPGRGRRGLKASLRQRNRSNRSTLARRTSAPAPTDTGGYFGVDKMIGSDSLDDYPAQEEDFLLTTNTFDVESDEDASSGDEDELNDIDELLKEDSRALDDEKKYVGLREPLFTPIGAENLANSAGGSMTGGGATGKLPFNRRKLRYFDSMNAMDRMAAREYLRGETRRSKQRELMMLAKHLKRAQRQERRRLKQERGETLEDTDLSDQEDDPQKSVVAASVSKFDQPMLPSMAAALLIESLTLNPLESIEGMAKCYDGIVAAGVALLESNVNDPTSPLSEGERPVGTRSQIMAALTPLLITSLEQPSGDVVLSIARLRRKCGTVRYQRRFVQRLAPSLIRPPKGAMWCLKHQNDMEPILAAAELIFDSAFEIFSKGWYDRGQLLLADSKRAETLKAAAMQLRNLSTAPSDNLTLGGFGGHGAWRTSKYVHKDPKASNEHLAEWEVIAVDMQIRISISNIISTDWSRVVVHSRDTDMARSYHRSRNSSKRTTILPSASGDMSPNTIVSSPVSPARPSHAKNPISPHGRIQTPGSAPPPQSETLAFPTNFAPTTEATDRAKSPVPPSPSNQPPPLSPPPPNRSVVDDIESHLPSDPFSGPSNVFPPSGHTPPKSPNRDMAAELPHTVQTTTAQTVSPMSPRRSREKSQMKESISNQNVIVPASSPGPQIDKDRAPLSPSSVGTGASTDMPYRPMSSASSVASSMTGTVGSQPAHYRMLTSTAAERKRTVAACRALRAQITRFEDAFIQLHGRPPKGAAERAPLATTYAQYREWKRAIRADAACRIQALFRGARTRWNLLRSNNPRMSRVVMSRAGRETFFEHKDRLQATGQDSVTNRLSIPAEIGEAVQEGSEPRGTAMISAQGNIGPDGFITQGQSSTGQALPPQWGNQIGRRRSGGNDGFSGSAVVPRPGSSPSGSVASSASSSDLKGMSLSDLQAHKRDLKQQLKQYDMTFARRHGRMPVKAEKEPIRHLYEKYNTLKSQITSMEQEGRQSSSASPVSIQQSSTVLSQRTVSPVSGSESGEESPVARRKMKPSHNIASASPSAPAGAPSQDLSALKVEKGRLHQMLRSYEKDFFKEHKRQVSSFADIRPVASQYRRYKEIKKAIASVQQGGEK